MKKRVLAAVLAVTMMLLGGCTSNPTPSEDELLQDAVDILDDIIDAGKENAGKDAGEYVTPDEADFLWEDVDGGVMITGYFGDATAVRIPSQLGGKDVVEIDGGISRQAQFTGIILPDTVKVLREAAFSFCTALVEVQFGSGLETIEKDAFIGCSALTEIAFNEGLQKIGYNSFSTCASLKKITISSTVKEIDDGAFSMTGLKTVVVPGTVRSIGVKTFSHCDELESVVIEDGVTTILEKAFGYNEALQTVTIPESVTVIERSIFIDSPNAVIVAPAGSYAEQYANENEIPIS